MLIFLYQARDASHGPYNHREPDKGARENCIPLSKVHFSLISQKSFENRDKNNYNTVEGELSVASFSVNYFSDVHFQALVAVHPCQVVPQVPLLTPEQRRGGFHHSNNPPFLFSHSADSALSCQWSWRRVWMLHNIILYRQWVCPNKADMNN